MPADRTTCISKKLNKYSSTSGTKCFHLHNREEVEKTMETIYDIKDIFRFSTYLTTILLVRLRYVRNKICRAFIGLQKLQESPIIHIVKMFSYINGQQAKTVL